MTEDGKNRGQGREDHFLARMTGMDTVTACHFSRNRVLDFLRPAVRRALAGRFGSVGVRGRLFRQRRIFFRNQPLDF